ncbi:uncharacterized protein LOC111050404 [Nilaparvata lugens]|uniref:uncharacterized protein LOC111050404 n=1 Tax=Nilaparvata lugens TaxID=108931 RepID=UPI00193CFFED|nr:uncharacterized protein LOC111050404 [Nilaparvata lugens]
MKDITAFTVMITGTLFLIHFHVAIVAGFYNDPYFPGNPGWMANFHNQMNQMYETFNDPFFPGNPGWMENLHRNMFVVPVNPFRPRPKPRKPRKPKIVKISIEDKNQGAQEISVLKDPLTALIEVVGNSDEKEKEKEKDPVTTLIEEAEKETVKEKEIPNSPCKEVPDPKIKFQENNYDSSVMFWQNGVQLVPKTEKKYYLCTDKKYGKDDYYKIKTVKSFGPNSFSSWEDTYDLKGNKMGFGSYNSHMKK